LAETHLSGGDISAFLSSVWSGVIGSVALREDSVHIVVIAYRAQMLTYQNSLLWQRCEHCNNALPSFWPPWLDQLNSVVITCRVLIGTNCKLVAYNYTSSLALERPLNTTWWMQTKVSKRSE